MSKEHIIALDQSTSATKAYLFDATAHVVSRVAIEHKQYYPRPGWVEHDALEILVNTRRAISEVIARSGVSPDSIAALAITNQRETVVAWDCRSGLPVHRAIVWQDDRGTDVCNRMLRDGTFRDIQKKTGLIVDTYFSASKLQWLLEHSQRCRQAADAGDLMAGTIDAWLIWNLTDRTVFATDYSNASRTLLFDIGACRWDDELRRLFGAEKVRLPEVRFADQQFGSFKLADSSKQVPIVGVMGDSHAALFGHAGFKSGDAKTTFGTGSSVMLNIGAALQAPPTGVVSSIGWGARGQVSYVFEGNIHSTGDTVRWVRDELGLFSDYAEAESRAAALADNGGVYLIPAFSGLGAPHWTHGVRASICGISRASGADHVIRAALESIAYQVNDVIGTMIRGGGLTLPALRVDGGPTSNRFLMQFLADILGVPVHVAETEGISARGVAFAAGIAQGCWRYPQDLIDMVRPAASFEPKMSEAIRGMNLEGWRRALEQTLASAPR